MNIGILQCDNVEEELKSQHGEYPPMFIKLFAQTNPTPTFRIYNCQQNEFPTHIDECDAYLITGSRHGVNDGLPWVAKLEELVRTLHANKKKIIGICFGHQLIAKALGGKVIKSPKGWGIGMSINQIMQQKPWMTPTYDTINLLVSHQDQVVELPPGAQVLASNPHCPFYMLQIENHLFTIQGHPEFSKAYSQSLMQKRQQIFEQTFYEEGLQSLQLEPHDQLIAQWIINFLLA